MRGVFAMMGHYSAATTGRLRVFAEGEEDGRRREEPLRDVYQRCLPARRRLNAADVETLAESKTSKT